MNGYDTPCTLHGELLKESNGSDALVFEEAVWIQEGTAKNTH
jgi:hypothetical protein